MRIRYMVVVVLLTAGAVPSIGSAQVVLQQPPLRLRPLGARVDRVVPVAVVSRVGQPMGLNDARTVQDSSGESFVIGAATLDLDDPLDPRVVFTLTNATALPMSWRNVRITEYGVWRDKRGLIFPAFDGIAPRNGRAGRFFPGMSGPLHALAGRDEVWEPGTAINLALPISQIPKEGEGELEGYLLLVQREGRPLENDQSIVRRAFQNIASPTFASRR